MSVSDSLPSRPRWLLRVGAVIGLCVIVALIWAAIAQNSRASAAFALVVVVALVVWMVPAMVVFARYTMPEARRPHISRTQVLVMLACIPLIAGVPLTIVGVNAHAHGLAIAGVILIAIQLIASSIALPFLSACKPRRVARRRGS